MRKMTGTSGGPAPFGYQFDGRGYKVPNPREAPVRLRMVQLFIEHRRVGTTATLLAKQGHRTRSGAPFSETSVRRLLAEPAPGIVPDELHKQCLGILRVADPGRPAKHLFAGLAFHSCGARLTVPSDLPAKYVCPTCRMKILAEDLEAIVSVKLPPIVLVKAELGELCELASPEVWNEGASTLDLQKLWVSLISEEKRSIVEQLVHRIVVGDNTINISFYDLRSIPSEGAAETHRMVDAPELAELQPQAAPLELLAALGDDFQPPGSKPPPARVTPTHTAPAPDQETLTLREAAHLLRLSESRVRVMVADGRLPSFRTGTGPKARIRVWRKDLDAAAAENFQLQTREEEAEAAEREIAELLAARKKPKR